jgi:predicted dithiol-disulfide oxidoreductase (DUF899 family)
VLGPDSDVRTPCVGCSSFTDNIPNLVHMRARDAFLRDGDSIYRTYFTTARGVDRLRVDLNLLDLTALGRQEAWQDSPEGWPQGPTMRALRRNDEYEAA